MKQTCYPPFWGDVGIKKWSPFLDSGAQSPIFWHLKTGTFGESARFQVLKNGSSDAETKKRRPFVNANYPPKWWNLELLVKKNTLYERLVMQHFYSATVVETIVEFYEIAHFLL